MTEPDPVRDALVRAAPAVDADAGLAVVRRRDRRARLERRFVAVAAAVVVVAAAAAGVVASRTADDTPEEEVPVATTTDDLDVVVATIPLTEPVSARRPVQVDPTEGLREGQRVTVTGQDFPPGRLLYVTVCLPEALEGGGTAACEAIGATAVHARPDGTFEVTHVVQRLLTVGNGVVTTDCGMVDGGCIVAAGDPEDIAESGGVPVSFDPSEAVPPPPLVTVTPHEGLHDGDEVDVAITGLDARSYLSGVNVCAVDDPVTGFHGCEPVSLRPGRADADGDLSFSFTVHRRIEPMGAADPVDCGTMDCVLVVNDSRYQTLIRLSFDQREPPPPTPTADVRLPDPLTPGARAEVDVTGFRPGQDVIVYLCPREAREEVVPCFGEELGTTLAGEDGSARLVVHVPGRTTWFADDGPVDGVPIDCTSRPGRCDLVVTNFYDAVERVPLTFSR
jgi:hypothetical protein